MAKWLAAAMLLLVAVAGVILVATVNGRRTPVSIGGQVVYARVANTDSQRTKGLSGTSSLGADQAMLFVFDSSGRWGIWMKDMHYNLDIVWMDSSKRVVTIAQNVAPSTYPDTFMPDQDAQYVLELPAGFVAAHNVSTGQIAGFSAQ